MDAQCYCGSVAFKTPLPQPLALYICHCDNCQKQTGSFGMSAIFPQFKLPESEALSCYIRPTATGQQLHCYFCRNCGTRVLHSTSNTQVVSIKGGCVRGIDWKKAVHLYTKNAMVPIPEGSETHSENSSGEYATENEILD